MKAGWWIVVGLATALAVALVSAPAVAGALYFYELANAAEAGYGGVGMVARANDAGTVFTNPAGMTRFNESELLVGATGVYIDAGFKTNSNNTVRGRSAGVNKRIVPAGSLAAARPLWKSKTVIAPFSCAAARSRPFREVASDCTRS